LALARQEKWSEAKQSFELGFRKAQGIRAFSLNWPVSLQAKGFSNAKDRLSAALRLGPQDAYVRES